MKSLLFLFLLIPSLLCAKYNLTVCAIFQNEAPYLKEWIDFHLSKGVEHFYLYNNLSTDQFHPLLEPYIKAGLVDLIDWPYVIKQSSEWNQIQCRAYLNCIKRARRSSEWVAMIDIDEFLFSPTNTLLTDLLRNYKEYPAVCVNWVMYGTSDIEKIPSNKKMLDCLVMRAELNYKDNRNVKSIVRPSEVIGCVNPHYFLYKDYQYAVTETFQPVTENLSLDVSVNLFRINHYWTRDREYFHKVKLDKRKKIGLSILNAQELEQLLNAVYDPILRQ